MKDIQKLLEHVSLTGGRMRNTVVSYYGSKPYVATNYYKTKDLSHTTCTSLSRRPTS